MRITATTVLPGDTVRGIGLVVEYSEPETDSTTRLEGYVSTRNPGYDQVESMGFAVDPSTQYERTPVKIVLPNEHRVNIRRADANYRLDLIGWVGQAFANYGATGDDDDLIEELTKVAGRARGIAADFDTTRHILGQLDPNAGDPNADFVDAYLDAGEGAFGTQEGADANWQEGPHGN